MVKFSNQYILRTLICEFYFKRWDMVLEQSQQRQPVTTMNGFIPIQAHSIKLAVFLIHHLRYYMHRRSAKRRKSMSSFHLESVCLLNPFLSDPGVDFHNNLEVQIIDQVRTLYSKERRFYKRVRDFYRTEDFFFFNLGNSSFIIMSLPRTQRPSTEQYYPIG